MRRYYTAKEIQKILAREVGIYISPSVIGKVGIKKKKVKTKYGIRLFREDLINDIKELYVER